MEQNGYTPFVFYLYFCIKNIDTNFIFLMQ